MSISISESNFHPFFDLPMCVMSHGTKTYICVHL